MLLSLNVLPFLERVVGVAAIGSYFAFATVACCGSSCALASWISCSVPTTASATAETFWLKFHHEQRL